MQGIYIVLDEADPRNWPFATQNRQMQYLVQPFKRYWVLMRWFMHRRKVNDEVLITAKVGGNSSRGGRWRRWAAGGLEQRRCFTATDVATTPALPPGKIGSTVNHFFYDVCFRDNYTEFIYSNILTAFLLLRLFPKARPAESTSPAPCHDKHIAKDESFYSPILSS